MGRLVAKCSERTGPQFCPRQVEHLGESDEQKTYLHNARISICMRDHERDRIRFSAPLPRWEAFRFKGRRLASAPESGLSPNRTPAELATEEGSEPFRYQNLFGIRTYSSSTFTFSSSLFSKKIVNLCLPADIPSRSSSAFPIAIAATFHQPRSRPACPRQSLSLKNTNDDTQAPDIKPP